MLEKDVSVQNWLNDEAAWIGRCIMKWFGPIVAGAALAITAAPAVGAPGTCDQACLKSLAERFTQSAMRGDFRTIPLSGDAEVRENTNRTAITATIWAKVRKVRSQMVVSDPQTGNVILRSGVEMKDGKPAYISTRLKRASSGRIVDVEIASDTSKLVVPDYVWNLDPIYSQTLPEGERTDRIALEAIVRRYFNSLGTHQAVRADFDDAACDRFHSGTKITHVAASSVEGGGVRTCISAIEGTPPWEPASEQRVPIIDVEHGVVVGVTLLHYPRLPGTPTMYVTEVFKIIKGRISRIDNIGLMLGTRETVGFVH